MIHVFIPSGSICLHKWLLLVNKKKRKERTVRSYPTHPNLSFLFSPACPPGSYKMSSRQQECFPCPANSVAEDEGSVVCVCEEDHFRTPLDTPSAPCTSNKIARFYIPARVAVFFPASFHLGIFLNNFPFVIIIPPTRWSLSYLRSWPLHP